MNTIECQIKSTGQQLELLLLLTHAKQVAGLLARAFLVLYACVCLIRQDCGLLVVLIPPGRSCRNAWSWWFRIIRVLLGLLTDLLQMLLPSTSALSCCCSAALWCLS